MIPVLLGFRELNIITILIIITNHSILTTDCGLRWCLLDDMDIENKNLVNQNSLTEWVKFWQHSRHKGESVWIVEHYIAIVVYLVLLLLYCLHLLTKENAVALEGTDLYDADYLEKDSECPLNLYWSGLL